MIIKDLSVAPFNIDAVSSISCIKVETPRSWEKVNKKSEFILIKDIIIDLISSIRLLKIAEPQKNNRIPFLMGI